MVLYILLPNFQPVMSFERDKQDNPVNPVKNFQMK